MLHDPARHEALCPLPWDEARARALIAHIARDTEARFSEERYWPLHPLDREDEDERSPPETPLYHGAAGVFWALHYLEGVGAVTLSRDYLARIDHLLADNRSWLGAFFAQDRGAYLLGDTPLLMLALEAAPSERREAELAALIAGNVGHPARELMWGAPGTLLAALFLHERTGKPLWADLFRSTAARLWRELQWSTGHQCAYFTQDLRGKRSSYLDAVHGFVGAAVPLIRGRRLLDPVVWSAWKRCLVDTVRRTASLEGVQASWRTQLDSSPDDQKRLLQLCHGAPGFVVCLAGLPGTEIDALLLAAGEAIWAAGPLKKGSNLCHGTGGNGYALLALHGRTGDAQWLDRARAFAMHGIRQTEADAQRYGQHRYSLWTGDLGFAVYLRDCLRAEARFPTLDVFYPDEGSTAEAGAQAR
jgi:hypothetical protein